MTFRRPDGTEFPAIVAAAAVRDAEGAVLGFIETVKDVTERERVDRLKDEFLSVVGHELRTPLSAVTAAVEMLAETPREELADGGRRLLEIARRNGERLARLINDTLDLERLTSGGEGLEAHPASVSRMVAEAVDAVRPSAAEAGVRLVVGRLPTVDRIVCDAGRVVQVLTNYLGNAVKFSPPGAAVEVVGTRAAGELRLSVADRGRGIPPDQLERVFERFAQVDASDRRLVGGTGLGLAIARAIAEMHGGRVWAESAEDRGSTFHLALPVR